MSGFYIETGGFQYAAAIDARHRAGQRRHDMAAGAPRILMQYPQTINDNSWYINGNSCKTNNQWQFVAIEFHPSPCGFEEKL